MRNLISKVIFISLLVFLTGTLNSQKVVLEPTQATKAFYHDKSRALRDMDIKDPSTVKNTWPAGIIKNNFVKRKFVKGAENKTSKTDRAIQRFMGTRSVNQNLGVNFDGMSKSEAGGATPPDPSGDVGPEHYFQMLNLAMEVYDKSGNSVYGPTANNTLFDGWDDGQPWDNTNDGDPIVLYDDQADRWMVSHFSLPSWFGPYYMLIAYSVTNDPLGSYYRYAYQFNDLPDYPKFGIWPDGLYLTLNSNSNNASVFQRDSMLVGNNAEMVSFSIPDYPGSGFKSALAADCDGTFPALGTPNYIIYYNDDAWGNYPTDHLRIWEFETDWANTSNSTLSMQNTLVTEPFDSNFGSGWSNISQPGPQKIDAIAQAMMYRVQYREFPAHSSMVCNYVVDTDGNDHAGIRWYELRKDTAAASSWYIYQQGTYAPDSDNRWLASIAMDKHGNIGMAFSVSSSTTYPSLRFTGHTVGAPLGVMNVTETEIITGSGSQSGTNRYGDYSQLGLDPSDDETFWFISEYIPAGGNWKTRIASFYFDPYVVAPIDAALMNYEGPQSASGLSNQEAISVKIGNLGSDTLYNIPLDLYVNGTLSSEDTVSGMLLPSEVITYTFDNLIDLSVVGIYNLMMVAHYTGDTVTNNDTLLIDVEHSEAQYCDASGSAGYEYISKVEVDNFTKSSGDLAYSDFLNDTVPLKMGVDSELKVTIGNAYNSDQVIVWFDWNQDLDFEDNNEKYIIGTGTGPHSSTIAVPAGAIAGNSRMRVRLHDTSESPNSTPCGPSGYGEVEDYTIFVEDPLSNQTIYPADLTLTCHPNPVTDQANISFTGINQDLIVQVINVNGKTIHEESVKANSIANTLTVDMESQPAGLYFARIRLSNYNIIDVKKMIKL